MHVVKKSKNVRRQKERQQWVDGPSFPLYFNEDNHHQYDNDCLLTDCYFLHSVCNNLVKECYTLLPFSQMLSGQSASANKGQISKPM